MVPNGRRVRHGGAQPAPGKSGLGMLVAPRVEVIGGLDRLEPSVLCLGGQGQQQAGRELFVRCMETDLHAPAFKERISSVVQVAILNFTAASMAGNCQSVASKNMRCMSRQR